MKAIMQYMKKSGNRIVILGIDGLDPGILSEGLKLKLLPNFKKLKDSGYYSELTTTEPPQSPVAWASFSTGVSPAGHGVFDFIIRNEKDYSLDLVWSVDPRGAYKARPFWEKFGRMKIPLKILFLPNTFPASPINGRMMAGMGTPDIFGTNGIYTHFTSGREIRNGHGRVVRVMEGDIMHADIPGPKKASVPVVIKKSGRRQITIGFQKEKVTLRVGEFSDWLRINFRETIFSSTSGIIRFYLRSLKPLSLYMSPINHNPENPKVMVSYPKTYSRDLARRYGLFSTLGMPHNTFALEDDVFTEEAFLENSQSIFDERKKIFLGELGRFKEGVFFNYVGATDTIQHMYWRFMGNPKNPYRNTIMDYYQKVDSLIGETEKLMGEDDAIIIVSDHGFGPFDYEFNVNSWLRDEDLLSLVEGKSIGRELLRDVDWGKTKAYGIGYNGIYINLAGREKNGTVKKKESTEIKRLVAKKMLGIVNPYTGRRIMKHVYLKEDLGIKTSNHKAPDLFLGYFKGVRTSWNSAVGGVGKNLFIRRRSKWRGDHLFDSSEVPGVILINKKVKLYKPKITDILDIVNKLHLTR